ncbi:MAG: hypothetical protein FWD23_13620 [Oscillospiraceae bacterium]|nr:hypothetical protein [Oscillospiraceae bacterium]
MDNELFEDARVNVKEQNLERQLISLVFEKDEQIERLNAEIEKLSAERGGQQKSESALADKDGEIGALNETIKKMLAEKEEQSGQIERLNARNIRLTVEKEEQNGEVERLKSEIAKLGADKGEKGHTETLIAEKNEQIEWLNARIRRLAAEKDEKNGQIERLTAEKDELVKGSAAAGKTAQFSIDNPGSLAEASLSVSGVLRAAQEAADVYLQNIKLIEAEKTAAAEKIEQEAKARANAIIQEAELRRGELEEAEKKVLGELRSVSFLYMDFIDKSHSALHEMIDRYKLTKLTQSDETGLITKNL